MSDKHHICFVGLNFPMVSQSSQKDYLWPTAEKIAEMGHKISIISWKNPAGKSLIEKENLKIYFLGEGDIFLSKEDFGKLASEKIEALHKEEKIDHVHSVDTSLLKFHKKCKDITLSYGIEATSMTKMFSLVNTSAGKTWGLFKTLFVYPFFFFKEHIFHDWPILRKAHGVFVSSPKQAQALERYYLFPPNWIFQIPLSSDISHLLNRKKSEELLQKLSLTSKTPTVVTSSDMYNSNEVLFLLDIFEKIAIKHPKAKLIIIGNGPAFKEVEKAVLMRALNSRVIFIKNIKLSEIPDYISLADIFVNVKYTTSGFGPTLVEAMAQEKIIIGSEFSPISEVIKEGENGFLIRPGDISRGVQLIDDIFDEKLDLSTIQQNARKDILKALSREGLAEKTLEAFKKIMKRKTGLFSF